MKLSPILFIALTIMLIGCNSNVEKAKMHFQKAKQFYKSEAYANALQEINKSITLDPSNYDYLIYSAEIIYELKEYDDAIKVLKKVLKKNYKKDTVNYKIGENYFSKAMDFNKIGKENEQIESNKKAINYYDNALKINIKYYSAYVMKAKSLYNNNKSNEAIITTNKAISIFPDSLKLVLLRGICKGNLGDISGEIKDINFVLSIKELDSFTTSMAYRFRGIAYSEKGKLKLALKDFSNAIKYNNKNEYLYEDRGNIYLKLKLIDSACQDFRTGAELGYVKLYDNIKIYCN